MLSYFVINPASSVSANKLGNTEVGSFIAHLLGIIPSNIVQIFLEYNVMAVVFSAFLIRPLQVIFLKNDNREFVEKFLTSFFCFIYEHSKVSAQFTSLYIMGVYCIIYQGS